MGYSDHDPEARREYMREAQQRYRTRYPDRAQASRHKYAATHREEELERGRLYREAHREEDRERARLYRSANQEQVRERSLVQKRQAADRNYGLLPGQYQKMLAAQDYCCVMCGLDHWANQSGKRLHVDHDHETGKVRALLCHSCNTGLGHFRDNPALLRAAADYIEFHQQDDWVAP